MLFNVFINDLTYVVVNTCPLYNYAEDNTLGFWHNELDDLRLNFEYGSKIAIDWFQENHMKVTVCKISENSGGSVTHYSVYTNFANLLVIFSNPDWSWGGHSSPMCYKMSSVSFFGHGLSSPLNSRCLVQTFLLLAAVCHSHGADDEWDSLQYGQHRIHSRGSGTRGWNIALVADIVYPALAFENSFPSESPTCLPIGDYHNGSVGYAVCNIDPSYTFIETMLRGTIINNITSLSVGFQESSGKEGKHSGCQCLRFFVRTLDQERDVSVSHLVTMTCPDFSFASLNGIISCYDSLT